MTGSLTLDVTMRVAAQLLILLIPWTAPHVVYVGAIDPAQFGEQAVTAMRARVYLGLPTTVGLCWFGTRWLDTRHDVAIVLYIALICRLFTATARFMRAATRDLSWIFPVLVGPIAAWAAVLVVARSLAVTDPSLAM